MDGSEVNVRFAAFTEIVIMDRNFFATPDDIARFASIIAGGKTVGLYWLKAWFFSTFQFLHQQKLWLKSLLNTNGSTGHLLDTPLCRNISQSSRLAKR